MDEGNSLLIREIANYDKLMEKAEDKNHRKHFVTRRVSLIALIGFVVSIAVITIDKLSDSGFLSNNILLKKLSEHSWLVGDDIAIVYVLLFCICLITVFLFFRGGDSKKIDSKEVEDKVADNGFKFYTYSLVFIPSLVIYFSLIIMVYNYSIDF